MYVLFFLYGAYCKFRFREEIALEDLEFNKYEMIFKKQLQGKFYLEWKAMSMSYYSIFSSVCDLNHTLTLWKVQWFLIF